jgi:glycosyltransferase involved in cell wall biosynthesis
MPVYNEESTVAEIVRRVVATGLAHELILIDDGSSDGTPAILDRLASGSPGVRLFRHESNRGKGAAIRTGLAAVSGDVVLVQDADLEYDPADYRNLLAPFADPEVEAVYGSRHLRRNPRSSLAFYWGGRFLSWLANCLHRSRLTDEATGYKLVRTGLLRELDVQSQGFAFCPELTGKLLRRGVYIHEVPISYRPRSRREGKKIRWSDGVKAVWTLLRYR